MSTKDQICIEDAKARLDLAATGTHEIGNLLIACAQLAEVIEAQQAEIDALKRQVARLVEATPSAGVVEEK